MIVYLARAIQAFVMYCVNGTSRSSLLIESTDSMICQSRTFRQPVKREGHEIFVLSGWGSMRQPYIESTTVFSNDLFFLLCFAIIIIVIIISTIVY